jgi:hypothetical protein
LQFVVRTFDPAGDRTFSHVFREGAADSRFAGGGQVRDSLSEPSACSIKLEERDLAMSWIKIAGKSLEFSGKIMQSASFEEWAESRGRQIVEQFAEKRTISLFSKWAARKELLSDLNNMAHQPALHTSLSVLAARYLTTIAEVSNSFEDNEFRADGKTYIVPLFSVRINWGYSLYSRSKGLQHRGSKQEIISWRSNLFVTSLPFEQRLANFQVAIRVPDEP